MGTGIKPAFRGNQGGGAIVGAIDADAELRSAVAPQAHHDRPGKGEPPGISLEPRIYRGDGLGIEPGARHRQEQPVADAAGPDRPGRAGGDQLGQKLGAARQPDLACQHIGGAKRQESERSRRRRAVHRHAVDDRVDGAVAAGRDDDVEFRPGLARQALGIAAGRPGAAHDDRAAAPFQRRDHPVEQAPRRPGPARRRVEDDQRPAPRAPGRRHPRVRRGYAAGRYASVAAAPSIHVRNHSSSINRAHRRVW